MPKIGGMSTKSNKVRVEYNLPNEFENNVSFRDDGVGMTMADFENEENENSHSTEEADQGQISASSIINNIREEEEIFQLISINIYDCHAQSTVLRINRQIKTKEICRAIAARLDLNQDEMTMYTLVVVLSVYDFQKRNTIHCIRTLQNEEFVLPIVDSLIYKLMERYQIVDSGKIRNSIRWYYKDIRTNPIEFGDQGEVTGEYSSDEEDYISPNDFSYLYKADRKGYLLKRSSRDQNLWRKWYCILTDHLWCINTNSTSVSSGKNTTSTTTDSASPVTANNTAGTAALMTTPITTNTTTNTTTTSSTLSNQYGQNKAICIPLSGMVRYRSNTNSSSGNGGGAGSGGGGTLPPTGSPPLDQIQSIIINSNKGMYLFRALTLHEQKKWIEDLQQKALYSTDNEVLNMAEVIMNDEEWSWSKKYEKHVLQELYDMDHVFELIMLPYRQQQLQQLQQLQQQQQLRQQKMFLANNSTNSAQLVPQQQQQQQGPPRIGRVKYARNISLPLHHSLQKTQPYLYSIFHLLEDILAYKETFRHDLLIPIPQQQKMAMHIFVKYLFPQLLLNQSTYYQYHAESISMKNMMTTTPATAAENEGLDSIPFSMNTNNSNNTSSKSKKWNNPLVNGNNFEYLYVKEEIVQEMWQTVTKRVTIAEYAPYFRNVVSNNATMNEIVTSMSSPTKVVSSNTRSSSPVPSRILTTTATPTATTAATGVIANLIVDTGSTFLPLTRSVSAVGPPAATNEESTSHVVSSTYFPNGHWVLPSNVIIQLFWLLFTKRVNIPEEDDDDTTAAATTGADMDEETHQTFATRASTAFGLTSSFLNTPATTVPTTTTNTTTTATNVSTTTTNHTSGNSSSFWSWFNRSGNANVHANASTLADTPRVHTTTSNAPRIEFIPNEPQIDFFEDIVSEIMNVLRNYPISSHKE